mmetsp:Transcript_26196/g.73250  ORF Transcript_26196/g.73250 Transcript_26196/m.73250 type:complete len:191 (-) Transcript_26196:143-715(-)
MAMRGLMLLSALAMLVMLVSGAEKPRIKVKTTVAVDEEDCIRAVDGKQVSIAHTGFFMNPIDGSVLDQFDSNGDEPLTYTLGDSFILKGLNMGVRGMCVGEKRQIFIPPALAFDDKSLFRDGPPNGLPAGIPVMYNVELLAVKGGETKATFQGSSTSIVAEPSVLPRRGLNKIRLANRDVPQLCPASWPS